MAKPPKPTYNPPSQQYMRDRSGHRVLVGAPNATLLAAIVAAKVAQKWRLA